MKPRVLTIFALAALQAGMATPARADLLEAVNRSRLHECAHPSAVQLRDSPRLRQAALAVADGVPLASALRMAGYRALQSSALHLSGAASDAQVSGLLAGSSCARLTDPKLTEIGVQRRGRDIWMVLAAPASLPSLRDAPLIRRRILDLVNAARQGGRRCGPKAYPAAAPLSLNSVLTSAALTHSEDMAAHVQFDHRGHDGSTPAARVADAGYGGYLVVGENIAAGVMTPEEVTRGWLESPAHCENIMDPRFSDIGIAFAVNYSSPELVYWTQDFAAPRRSHAAGTSTSNR